MTDTRERTAEAFRRLALNEDAKQHVLADPTLRGAAKRIAERYVAGEVAEDALRVASRLHSDGIRTTIDYMGESVRTPQAARAATDEFVALARLVAERPVTDRPGISLDLSHIGSLVDRRLAREHLASILDAAANGGIEVMISMENHDRTDQILDDHAWVNQIHADVHRDAQVGITLQARLNRSEADLVEVLKRRGRVRVVKGAYPFPDDIAIGRDDPMLGRRFDAMVRRLLQAGKSCSIATHDPDRIGAATTLLGTGTPDVDYHFEFLHGIGPAERDRLRRLGHPVQQYLVYGEEWFLYVCNRIAEDPEKVFTAVIDAVTQ